MGHMHGVNVSWRPKMKNSMLLLSTAQQPSELVHHAHVVLPSMAHGWVQHGENPHGQICQCFCSQCLWRISTRALLELKHCKSQLQGCQATNFCKRHCLQMMQLQGVHKIGAQETFSSYAGASHQNPLMLWVV